MLVWLGDRSFSIYLIHVPVFWAFSMLVFGNRFVPGIYAGAAFAVAIPTVLLLSDLSYRFYETPARRWINSYSPNRMKPFFRSTERQRS